MTISVVQTPQNGSVATTCTVTLNPTGAGNCLVVWTGTSNATTNAAVSGITLGGSADHFGSLVSVGTGAGSAIGSFWADPNCAGGQTTLVVTVSGGVGAGQVNVTVLEVSGLVATLAALLDQSITTVQTSSTSTWTTGTTPSTTSANELWVGGVDIAASEILTGPATGGWSNLPQIANGNNQTMVGYQVATTTATVTYAGTINGSTGNVAAAIALFGAPPQAPAPYPRPSSRVVTVPFFAGVTGAQHSR